MKTISKLCLMLATSATMLTACSVQSWYVVRERPVESVYERPAPPYSGAVWISGEWEWRHDHYEHINGHYEHASTRVWVEGHWRQVPTGWVWDKGHWQ
jgi:hypothetical protein